MTANTTCEVEIRRNGRNGAEGFITIKCPCTQEDLEDISKFPVTSILRRAGFRVLSYYHVSGINTKYWTLSGLSNYAVSVEREFNYKPNWPTHRNKVNFLLPRCVSKWIQNIDENHSQYNSNFEYIRLWEIPSFIWEPTKNSKALKAIDYPQLYTWSQSVKLQQVKTPVTVNGVDIKGLEEKVNSIESLSSKTSNQLGKETSKVEKLSDRTSNLEDVVISLHEKIAHLLSFKDNLSEHTIEKLNAKIKKLEGEKSRLDSYYRVVSVLIVWVCITIIITSVVYLIA